MICPTSGLAGKLRQYASGELSQSCCISGWARRLLYPLDEQTFLVNTINRLQKSPDWKNTAVVIFMMTPMAGMIT